MGEAFGRFSTGMERLPFDETVGHFAEGSSSAAVDRRPARFSRGQESESPNAEAEIVGSFATGVGDREVPERVRGPVAVHGMVAAPQEG